MPARRVEGQLILHPRCPERWQTSSHGAILCILKIRTLAHVAGAHKVALQVTGLARCAALLIGVDTYVPGVFRLALLLHMHVPVDTRVS